MSKHVFNNENLVTLWQRNGAPVTTNRPVENDSGAIGYVDHQLKYNDWRSNLIQRVCDRHSIIWGAAGKGVMLLNMLNLDYKLMPEIIDINPRISNKYIPIMGNKIVLPSNLREIKPETIFILNSIYTEEITYQVRQMGLRSVVEPLFGFE